MTKEAMEKAITIVLADDHRVVRDGVWRMLGAEPDLRVVGEAADGREALRLVERLQPDILVTDLMMGAMNGFEVAREVSKHSAATGVIILSTYGDEAYVAEALQAGARGYVLKEAASGELVRAIHEVAAGRSYLSPPLSAQSVEAYHQKSRQPPAVNR